MRVTRAGIVLICALFAACTLTGCDWAMYGLGANHSGNNASETSISPATVSQLQLATTYSGPTGTTLNERVVVAGGMVYASADVATPTEPDHAIYAFSEKGNAGCTGTPRKCKPVWGAKLAGDSFDTIVPGTIAVANGVLYVVTLSTLYAYNAAGGPGCVGVAPPMCSPLWTASVGSLGSVTVAGGTVFVGSDQALFAFDATGTTGCSGVAPARVCAPLWTAPTAFNSGGSSPSVANDVVYIGSDTTLYAFDARGITRCSGAPKTCAPLWTASLGGGTASAPSVVNGVVYVGASDGFLGSGTGRLYAFDAAGTQQCSGPVTARVCNPLWTAAAGEMGQPAVAGGRVFVGSSDGMLYAFDAAGQVKCSGAPKTCQPLMRAAAGASPPAVANDVVYIQNATAAKIVAVDATGNLGCSGAPPLCTPLWSANNADFNQVPPIIANSVVYFSNGQQAFGYALASSPPHS